MVTCAMLIFAGFSSAHAQFVPVPSDENADGAATPPNLKVLKTIPSAPFEDLSSLQTPEESTSGKTARVRIKEIDDAAWLPFGAFQRGQYLKAMELALPRAQLGDPAAQTLLAELFAEGFGVGRSMDDAVFWYDQAAKNGDPAAQYKLALLLTDGRYVERNDDRARELMKQSAEAGNAKAQFNFAQLLVAEKPGPVGIREALPFFEKSAARGIPDAQYALSQIYINALDVDEAKRAIARRHLIAAARAGYDTARLDLAIWLIDGVGGDRDFEAGFEWMSLAALTVMRDGLLALLIPTIVIVIVGLFTARVPAIGAKIVIVFHVLAYGLIRFVFDDVITLHFIHLYAVLFAIEVAIMLVCGWIAPRDRDWQFTRNEQVDLTPWPYAKPLAATFLPTLASRRCQNPARISCGRRQKIPCRPAPPGVRQWSPRPSAGPRGGKHSQSLRWRGRER